jgi:aspartyl-tRNA(Asn)/glutamyl-tRNA(Gln) amidotransferase subunit B
MEYEPVIGLEVHAQLLTKSKIFCDCSTKFGAEPNTHVCPVCLGMPGVLPVLNRTVVEFAMMLALSTNSKIAPYSQFARKNYFYPDLPKGYQISQYELPLAEHGFLEIDVNGSRKRIGITRIHMEEDAGKLIHDEYAYVSYVDFNRAGVPLVEIVSEPDIRSAEEAGSYLRKLRDLLRYLDICDGNMEEGSFRCDANVSIRPKGSTEFGTRTELKNMNSFRHVMQALEFEILRQQASLEEGKEVVQETRLWDPAHSRTQPMRGKEESHDYRYFPEPDLLPIVIDQAWIEGVRSHLPELPDDKKARFMEQYELSEYDASVLTAQKSVAVYYEACLEHFKEHKTVANWVMGDLMYHLKNDNREIEECPVTPAMLVSMLKLIADGTISGKIAKTIFEEMYNTGRDPMKIVKEKGLVQVSDTSSIEALVQGVIKENPKEVQAYRAGKHKLLTFFVGQVMKKCQGKANPKVVNEILQEKLK